MSANTCTHTTTHATRQYPHQRQSKTINTSPSFRCHPLPSCILPAVPSRHARKSAHSHKHTLLHSLLRPSHHAVRSRQERVTRHEQPQQSREIHTPPQPCTGRRTSCAAARRAAGQRHVARTNACAATSAERRANGTACAAFALRAPCRATRLCRRALFPNSLSPRGGNVPLADALRLTLAPCVPACCLLSACARAAQRYVLSCPSLSHPPPCAALAHQAVQARARLSSAAGHIVLCAACLAKGVQVDSDSDGGGVAGHGRTTLLPRMQWSGTATRRRKQAGGYLLAGGASVGLGRGHHEPAADADTGNRGRHTHARTRQVRRMRTRER